MHETLKTDPVIVPKSHLMQLSGSFSQSVLHLNRSQVIHPIGGVFARPLSSAKAPGSAREKERDSRRAARIVTDGLDRRMERWQLTQFQGDNRNVNLQAGTLY